MNTEQACMYMYIVHCTCMIHAFMHDVQYMYCTCKLMLYGNLHLQHVGCWMCPYIVQYMYICKTFYMYTQVQFYLYMKCTNIHTYMYMCPSSHILCKVPVSLPYLISTAPKCLQAVSLRASNCRHDTTRRHGRNLTPVASRQNAV